MAEQVNLKASKPKKNFITLNKMTKKPVFVKRKGYTEKNDEKTIRHLSMSANIIGALCLLLFSFCIIVFVAEVFVPIVSGKEEENTVVIITPPEEKEEEREPELLGYDGETGVPIYNDSFNLFLVNNSNPMKEGHQIIEDEVQGVTVDSRIATALRVMINAAKEDGVDIKLSSGLLSLNEQQERFDKKRSELIETNESTEVMADFRAGRLVGYPGKCEESTGMSVSIEGDSETFIETDVYTWLNNNAADYGFVFRFPKGKTDLTGRNTDYTVLRYVGKDNALKMRQLSFCLEEFVRYKNQTK